MPAFSLLVPAGMSLLGGLMGSKTQTTGAQAPKTTVQNGTSNSFTQNAIDPRMEPYIYGDNGVLSRANSLYQSNPTGLNPQMLQGMNSQWNQLGASKQGYDQMQNLGMGLMGGGTAGNPFTGGGGIAPQSMTYKPATLGAGSQTIDPFQAIQMPAPVAVGGYGGGGIDYGGGGDGSGQPKAPTAPSEPFNPLGYLDEDGNWVNKTRVGGSNMQSSSPSFGGYFGYSSPPDAGGNSSGGGE
jgi:hypothetical protein